MASVPPARATLRDPARRTLADGASLIAGALGWSLMPWQAHVARVGLEVDDTGRPVYPVVLVTLPRRAGKSVLTTTVAVHGALRAPARYVWYTAQTRAKAAEWYRRTLTPRLASSALAGHYRRRDSQGSEAVTFDGSSLLGIFDPAGNAMHGEDSDLVIVDEAWRLSDSAGERLMHAIAPTQQTRPGAQLWIVSTVGDEQSGWLRAWCDRADAGEPGLARFDWSCPDGTDPLDESAWPTWHPGYEHPSLARADVDAALRTALNVAGETVFLRAYANRWPPESDGTRLARAWPDCVDPLEVPQPAAGVVLAADVALDRSAACVVAAWHDGDVVRVELVDYRPGTAWLPDRVADLARRRRPLAVAVDSAGPARDVASLLESRRVTITPTATADYVAACAEFTDLAVAGRLRVRSDPALTLAATGARSRVIGDRGTVWDRRTDVDVSPLAAATVASWHLRRVPTVRAVVRGAA